MFLLTKAANGKYLLTSAQVGGLVAVLALMGLPTRGAEPPGPTVAQVMDDFVKAAGGKPAFTKITSSITSGTFLVSGQKITGTFEVKAKAPNKILVTQNIQGIGKSEQGYDGKEGWMRDATHGLRTLSGVELEQMRLQARFNAPLFWKELYSKADMLGVKTVNGVKAYAVRLTPKLGKPAMQYFDVKTKLLVREDQIQEIPEGAIPVETYPSNWHADNGVKLPYTIRMMQGGAVEIVLTTTAIKNNVPIDDSVFAKPAGTSSAPPK